MYVGEPLGRVGPIAFGMLDAEVRERLGVPDRSVQHPLSDCTTDVWFDRGLHVEYDFHRGCCAITVVPPSGLVVLGTNLGALSADAAVSWVRSRDPSSFEDLDGITSYRLGISIGLAPSQADRDDEAPIEYVIEAVQMFSSQYGQQMADANKPPTDH